MRLITLCHRGAMAPLRLGPTDPCTGSTPGSTPGSTSARTTRLAEAFPLTARAAATRRTHVPPGVVLRSPDLDDLRPGDLGPAGPGGGRQGRAGRGEAYGPGTLVDLRSAGPRDRPGLPLTLAEARVAVAGRWTDGGLLLGRAVPAVHGGTARLRPEGLCDVVAAFEVTAQGRTSGEGARTLLLPRLGRLHRPHRGGDAWRTPLPPWGMRLSRLLRAVRPLADGGTAEWADDGHRCHLLLLHPAD